MLILGIDTSCDDTSAAVVRNGTEIVSNVVSTQTDIHTKYGGIVPELASRKHIEMILPVVDKALKEAEVTLSGITAVAVCHGPGLIGSLLVGCSFAKALCYAGNIPLVAVNHLEGHIFSAFLENPLLEFPFLSLVVSGGHTSLYYAEGYGRYTELGRTRDDAAGEAFDKVSKLLGLGYPGGPLIDKLSEQGKHDAIEFPRAYLPESHDFSFSGMKTAVLNFLRVQRLQDSTHSRGAELHTGLVSDIAASFQSAMVDVLVRKTEMAVKALKTDSLTLSGGVSANRSLRQAMQEMCSRIGIGLFVPSISLCTDNAAMIAAAGYHHFVNGDLAGLDMNPKAYLSL